MKCPVAGCAGKWVKADARIDEEFKLMMLRFERVNKSKPRTNTYGSSSSSAAAVELVDDDDD